MNSVIVHPNEEELISGDQNGNVRVWELAKGSCSCELVPEIGTAIRSISVAYDGSLAVAANNNGTCFVWRLSSKTGSVTHFEPLHKLKKPDSAPQGAEWASTSSDKTIKLWSLENFELKQTLKGHQKWVWDCVFSVDAAYLVSASSDCTACLWDLSNGDAIRVYSGHQKAVCCCALNDCAVEPQE